jgi:hypothetical protein
MGSIYPHFSGTRDERVGYDSYDFTQIKPVWMDLYRWAVRAGSKHITVLATTLDRAKARACEKRGWTIDEITSVYIRA